MKIGILSDTHGNLEATKRAAEMMLESGAQAVFHCGDIGGMDVLSELAAVFEPQEIPVHVVFGNVDVHSSDWKFFPSNVGITLHGAFGDIDCDGTRIGLLHGDDAARLRQAVASGKYDLMLSGHTHEPHDVLKGKVRCINPGTAGRGAPGTCAVLDLDSGELTLLRL